MEICVDTIESARNAIEGQATRLELCSALSEGGLTPTPGLLEQVKNLSTTPIYAMLRIRGGDFQYSRQEVDAMLHDLKILKEHGVNGFVFGALNSRSEVDVEVCSEIVATALPLPVTFHRAFDTVVDPLEALEVVAQLGFERILTSGQKNRAVEGLELIGQLVRRAGDRVVVMPGSGITKENLGRIKMVTGAKEFHASARRRKALDGGRCKVKIGADEEPDFAMVTDAELVREMTRILKDS